MSDREEHKYYSGELKKLQKAEADKRLLYNKQPGASSAPTPRPSDDFIEKCVGRLKSNPEVQTQARANALARELKEENKSQQQREVQYSQREHQRRLEQRMKQKK